MPDEFFLPLSKQCTQCKKILPASEFQFLRNLNNGRKPALDTWCRACKSIKAKKSYQLHLTARRIKHRDFRRKYKYGLTRADYDAMLLAQGGVCAICKCPEISTYRGKIRDLAVDHSHKTGTIRKLLCTRCNQGLGGFRDDPLLLEAAAAYLRAHQQG